MSLLGTTRFLLFAWLTASAAMAAAEDGYIGDQNGCKIANPNPRPNETVSWSGECRNGFGQDGGVMEWMIDKQPGPRYEGALDRGELSGTGKLTMPDGTTYQGGWSNGKQNGVGKLALPGGDAYEGEWKDGQPDGEGTMILGSGQMVKGVWKEGALIAPAQENPMSPAQGDPASPAQEN
ncbi:MAG: hypothetical protein ABI612_19720 [Betaproteobacteria bacterium]